MRKLAFAAPVLLAACSTAPPPSMIHGDTPGHVCDASAGASFVGQPGTSDTGAAIVNATRAAVLRWAPPGYMMTMDFRADRVTVHLGPDGRITKVACG